MPIFIVEFASEKAIPSGVFLIIWKFLSGISLCAVSSVVHSEN